VSVLDRVLVARRDRRDRQAAVLREAYAAVIHQGMLFARAAEDLNDTEGHEVGGALMGAQGLVALIGSEDGHAAASAYLRALMEYDGGDRDPVDRTLSAFLRAAQSHIADLTRDPQLRRRAKRNAVLAREDEGADRATAGDSTG
jgi:hypothetical protein